MTDLAARTVADTIIGPASTTLMLAEALSKGIKASKFARQPEGVQTNHPAFIFGHLSIYPDLVMLPILGREDLAKPVGVYEDLFKHGVDCRDDPDGSIYPSMDEITTRFFERTKAVIELLGDISAEALDGPPPDFFADRFPNAGATVNFMLIGHAMMHLGQLSAWRRCQGLGPAM